MRRTSPPRPFFIVGSDRSGTTLLRLMLNEHPEVHVPRESWFLIDLMNELPRVGRLGPDQLERAYQIISTHSRWRDWEIPDDRLRCCLCALDSPSLGDLSRAVFTLSAERTKKPRWGDKTPEYVREIPRLRQLLPDAQFIHVIRDARDVCVSLLEVQFRGSGIWNSARYWNAHVSAGLRDGRALPNDVYLEVGYEQVVLETERTLRRLCSFLGLEYAHRMHEFYKYAERNIAPWEKDFHRKTMRPPSPADVQRWRSELSRRDLLACEAICGRTMESAGQARALRGGVLVLAHLYAACHRVRLGVERILARIGSWFG